MLFEKVKKEHILQAIKDFEEKGFPTGFKASSTYDVVFEGKNYPPKAIMVYANFHAEGRTIEPYFKGGLETDCFKAFERNGFTVIKKQPTELIFQIQVSKTDKTAEGNFLTAKLKIVNDGYQLLKGSYIYKEAKPSFLIHSYYKMRVQYEKEGYFEDSYFSKYVILKKSITFNKPSPAAVITLNRAANGKHEWKLQDGTTLEEYENKKIKPLRQINYWIFQGNPDIYRITNALNAAHLKSWNVAAHKDKIKIGDKVIIWQTGKNAGCYALAEVTSEVSVFEEEKYEKQYYIDKSNHLTTERVRIKITNLFASDPILWSDIKNNLAFSAFKAGNQGTNFYATKNEYNTLLNWIEMNSSIKDVKEEFAIWLQANTYDSYRNYIGSSKNETITKLEEINQFFSDIELFKVNPSKVDEHITKIVLLLSKKERVKNEAFVEYDIKNSNGIPKAIIGKNNYLKFLDEKYNKQNSMRIIDDYKIFLKSNKLRESQIDMFVENFQLVYNTPIEKPVLNYIKISDFEYFSKINFSRYEYLTNKRSTRKGQGYRYFKEFFIEIIGKTKEKKSLNQILYGPPGTGKTYYLKNKLFEKYTSTESNITKEENFTNVVSQCSWWQVIAIALLELGKCKVNDINQHPWVLKKASLSNSKTIRPTLWGQLQSHTVLECTHVNVSGRANPLLFSKSEDSYWEIDKEITQEVAPELFEWLEAVNNFKPNPDKIIERFTFVTFHQSFAYEDFIEGIKPVFSENETGDLGYQVEEGVFKEICNKAKNDPANKYAIFIDEINRANVSAVFGELITLIETDKRLGTKNELQIKLPYSKTLFGVPANLDIYGTMNTADRSIEALDTALRRRFSFVEMMPDMSVLTNEIEGVAIATILEKINNRIEVLLDRDHAIGHSYFINCSTIEKLEDTFKNNIIPLLQEYFYGDYGKIGLILGEGFVKKVENDDSVFSSFEYDGRESLASSSYELIQFDQIDFSNAIEKLLK